jgi:uncharacterized membrane protein YqjE
MTDGKVYEMPARRPAEKHDRSLGSIVAEIRDETKEFLNTRLQMLKSEFQETMSAIGAGLPFAVAAIALLGTAFLLITAAVVALVALALVGNPYAWFFAFAIVGALWLILGGLAGLLAYNKIRSGFQFPKQTVEVLKADTVWLQSETRQT